MVISIRGISEDTDSVINRCCYRMCRKKKTSVEPKTTKKDFKIYVEAPSTGNDLIFVKQVPDNPIQQPPVASKMSVIEDTRNPQQPIISSLLLNQRKKHRGPHNLQPLSKHT